MLPGRSAVAAVPAADALPNAMKSTPPTDPESLSESMTTAPPTSVGAGETATVHPQLKK